MPHHPTPAVTPRPGPGRPRVVAPAGRGVVRPTAALVAWGTTVLASCATLRPVPARPDTGGGARGLAATVVHVVDGDTVDLRFAGDRTERARLLGIDTPETVKPDTPVQCFGPEASARTKALLGPGTRVLVQRDEEARDRYGRLLLYVWRSSDGLFVNRALVADGYARTLSITPNTAHRADLGAALAAARARRAGLWGRCAPSPGDGP